MMGVYLHVMADTLGSVGVIISTLLIEWYGWTGFDPIASLFIAFMITISVIPLVVDAGRILCLDLRAEQQSEVVEALNEVSRMRDARRRGTADGLLDLRSCTPSKAWLPSPRLASGQKTQRRS